MGFSSRCRHDRPAKSRLLVVRRPGRGNRSTGAWTMAALPAQPSMMEAVWQTSAMPGANAGDRMVWAVCTKVDRRGTGYTLVIYTVYGQRQCVNLAAQTCPHSLGTSLWI